MEKREKWFVLLSGLFVGFLVVSNVIAVKIVHVGALGGLDFFVPAAVLCYALTFAISDVVAEVWGKERTYWLVLSGFFVTLISALLIQLAIHLPGAPFWQMQESFVSVLGANLRITLAGLTAYLLSQYHDVWAFHFWKRRTGGRHLWLRNNASTSVSQLLDTVVFITIAFYGVEGVQLGVMILSQYLVKLAISVLDTPLVYALVWWIRKTEGGKDNAFAAV